MFSANLLNIQNNFYININLDGKEIKFKLGHVFVAIGVIGLLILIFNVSFSDFISADLDKLLAAIGSFVFVGGFICAGIIYRILPELKND